jgi:menaquinone-dependent protoporphyrinogen oxidase
VLSTIVPGTTLAREQVMSRIGIVFASSHGQTATIAATLADHLRRRGHVVELGDALAGSPPPPEDYDAMVIGSRVQSERHAKAIVSYVRSHRASLADMPSFFFSVSMSAAKRDAGPDPHGYIARFCRDTGWEPDRRAAFAGALRYTRYGWFLRVLMKLISWRTGNPTDTSRDHELTDWATVARFAEQLDAVLAPAMVRP